jgi:hypothetical protein
MSGLVFALDTPGTSCAFDSNHCSTSMLGRGGFDQHHPIPLEFGGDPNQPLLPLCPNHHRRQHALIRYLIECLLDGTAAQWPVLEHFTADERAMAERVPVAYDAAGRPPIPGWPCPAARA